MPYLQVFQRAFGAVLARGGRRGGAGDQRAHPRVLDMPSASSSPEARSAGEGVGARGGAGAAAPWPPKA